MVDTWFFSKLFQEKLSSFTRKLKMNVVEMTSHLIDNFRTGQISPIPSQIDHYSVNKYCIHFVLDM